MFLIYTDDERLGTAVARQLRDRLARGRPRLVDVMRVDGDRWYPLLRRHVGRATPYDVSSHAFLAAAVFEGRVVQRSRAELAATLQPDPAAVAEVEAHVTGRPQSAGWVAALLERCVGATTPSPGETARLLESIAVPAIRDVAWEPIRRSSARDHVRFWSDLVRQSPEDLVAHAAAVLAFAAWIAGDGALPFRARAPLTPARWHHVELVPPDVAPPVRRGDVREPVGIIICRTADGVTPSSAAVSLVLAQVHLECVPGMGVDVLVMNRCLAVAPEMTYCRSLGFSVDNYLPKRGAPLRRSAWYPP